MSEEVIKPNEETTKEQPEEQIEVAEQNEIINEVKEESNLPVEEQKEKEPESKTARLAEKKITCPKCSKTMNLRSYRYKHEKNCQGNLEDRPIKKQVKPKVKAVPLHQDVAQGSKTVPIQPVNNEVIHQQQPTQPVIKKSPYEELMDSYSIIHQEYLNKRREKVNNLTASMFSGDLRKKEAIKNIYILI